MKKILVIGDGILGNLIANSMTEHNHRVFILSSFKNKKNINNRYFSLNLLSKYFLSSLNLWPKDTSINSFNKIQTWDDETRRPVFFRSSDISFDSLGYIIKEEILITLLKNKTKKNKKINYVKKLDTKLGKKNYVVMSNGKKELIDLIVCTIRDEQFEHLPTMETIDYNQEALVSEVSLDYKNHSTALQNFSGDNIQGFLPIGNSKFNLIWSANKDYIKYLKSLKNNKIIETLQKSLNYTQITVNKFSSPSYFPLNGYLTKSYYVNNLLLIGSAAHSVHPMAGMGLNMGIQEIFIISKLLEDNNSKLDEKLLTLCDLEFRKVNSEIYHTINFLKKFYNNNNLTTRMKSISLKTFNSSKFLKKNIISKATGIETLKSFNVLK